MVVFKEKLADLEANALPLYLERCGLTEEAAVKLRGVIARLKHFCENPQSNPNALDYFQMGSVLMDMVAAGALDHTFTGA